MRCPARVTWRGRRHDRGGEDPRGSGSATGRTAPRRGAVHGPGAAGRAVSGAGQPDRPGVPGRGRLGSGDLGSDVAGGAPAAGPDVLPRPGLPDHLRRSDARVPGLQRSPAVLVASALPAEIIMLRARTGVLVGDLRRNDYYRPFNVEIPTTTGIVGDLARARDQAGRGDMGKRLAEAEKTAKNLLQALHNRGTYKGHLGNSKNARDLAHLLHDSLLRIPVDLSGLGVTTLELPRLLDQKADNYERFEAVWGVIWTDDTIWPDAYKPVLKRLSRTIHKGMDQVTQT